MRFLESEKFFGISPSKTWKSGTLDERLCQHIVFIFSLSRQRWGQMTIWPHLHELKVGPWPRCPPPPPAAASAVLQIDLQGRESPVVRHTPRFFDRRFWFASMYLGLNTSHLCCVIKKTSTCTQSSKEVEREFSINVSNVLKLRCTLAGNMTRNLSLSVTFTYTFPYVYLFVTVPVHEVGTYIPKHVLRALKVLWLRRSRRCVRAMRARS